MRVLLIGGTGFVGSAVTEQLVKEGHLVAVFHRGKTPLAALRGVTSILDKRSTVPITSFPGQALAFQPDVVIHTFAMGQADAGAAMRAFCGHTARLVLLSSGDVYRAYGRFTRIESGPVEPDQLTENSPLRTVLFPYRNQAQSHTELNYWYEKMLAESAVLGVPELPGTVLRLPKVYGPRSNANLSTVYGFREHPHWRWTHGYVENVAKAIVLAATHPRAAGRVYNVGEADTPTIAERLERLPLIRIEPAQCSFDFTQDIAYDTTRIRHELGYREAVPELDAMIATIRQSSQKNDGPELLQKVEGI